MFRRTLTIGKNYSIFLFGPRGVGKTTFLRASLPEGETYWIDLLDFELETRFLQSPRAFREILETLPSHIRWVVIDEVQKVPFLLNEVHRQIELKKNRCFALTGSSARKLKRGQANLLAGRAFTKTLFPLTIQELGDQFQLEGALEFGTLPKIFSFEGGEDRKEFLKTYARTYLQEEIQMEGLVRTLPSFRKFLPLAANANGEILSWANLAQDVGHIDAKTIRSYFEVLEDTLVGFLLPAYSRSLRKRQRTHPKFYFFDSGVKRALANQLSIPLIPGTPEYGRAFEHFWILEIMRMSSYLNLDWTFSYFATHDVEVDLVIERPGKTTLFAEIKASEFIKESEIRGLKSLVEGVRKSEAICISRDPRKRKVGSVLICPWKEALVELSLG